MEIRNGFLRFVVKALLILSSFFIANFLIKFSAIPISAWWSNIHPPEAMQDLESYQPQIWDWLVGLFGLVIFLTGIILSPLIIYETLVNIRKPRKKVIQVPMKPVVSWDLEPDSRLKGIEARFHIRRN